jgi:lipopolysaccharide export system permease protein
MFIIDRYLLRQYVRTFVICWISMTGLYVVVDAFSNLDEFLKYSEESNRNLFRVLGEFYLFRSVFFFDRISAVLAMVAAMFTITWLQRHQELTALMAAGLSRIRAAKPIMAAAVVITFCAVFAREFAIPIIRDQLIRDPKDLLGNSLQKMEARVDNETRILFRGEFTQANEMRIHRPSLVLPAGLNECGMHLAAANAYYHLPTADRPAGYLLKEVSTPLPLLKHTSLRQNGREVVLTPADHGDFLSADECFVVSNVDFDQISAGQKIRKYLGTPELIRGLRNPSLDYGADVRVLIHSRMVQPLLDVNLLFLALPLVMRREMKNIYAAIGMCVLLTALFMIVVMACQYMGSILLIRPSLAAWLPLLIFVPTAVAMYDRIDR